MKTPPPDSRLLPSRAPAGLALLLAGACLAPLAGLAEPPGIPPMPAASPAEGALASENSEAARRPSDGLKRADRRFLVRMAKLGETEILLSRVAESRAINPQVRAFAAVMAREHGTAHDELKGIASRRGVEMAKTDPVETREREKKWAEKKGDDFDEDYLEAIIEAHQDAIDMAENGAESDVPEIAAYANKMLPILKGHLARAEALEAVVDD